MISSRILRIGLPASCLLAGLFGIGSPFLSLDGLLAADAPKETAPGESVLAAQKARQMAMAKASQATIAVFGLDGGGGGSGVLVTPDGYALTNFHVSSACGDHMRCGLADGRMVDAVIVGIDATGDVSLIRLLGSNDFPVAPMGDSDKVRVGQWCFAAGNPFGLATNLQPSVSLGMISGTGRYQYPAGTLLEYSDCLQTDAAINPGNSGGPLFNLDGEVIGINGRCSFEKRGRVNVGVGYAISINQIKNFLGMLRSGRLVDHATLGATVSTDDSGKVLVSNILNGSDAYRRGLRYGDEITSLAGREIQTTNDLKNVLGTLPKDWRIPVVLHREGQSQTLLVRLMGVHTEQQLNKLVAGESDGKQPQRPGGKRPGGKRDPNPEGDKRDEDLKEAQELDKAAEQNAQGKETDAESADVPGRPNFKRVKSMLQERDGFANFYFNRLEQQQVAARIQTLGDFKSVPNNWQFAGKLASEPTPVAIQIHPANVRVEIGKRKFEVPLTDAVAAVADKGNEEGLLIALRAWQQLLIEGPEKMGSTIYLGTAPVYPTLEKTFADVQICDVLQTDWVDAMVRFYVPVGENHVNLIEVYGDSVHDPVEVYLDQYRELEGRKIPGRVRLQYGTDPRLLLVLESLKFTSQPAQETPGAVEEK